MIDAGLFKKYDIRGRASGDGAPLTIEAARAIGQAFGTHLRRAGVDTAVVGQDNRESSPVLADAAIAGLVAAGIDVMSIGMTSTPVVYWMACQAVEPISGMMVTGSHLAPEYNGFKLSIGARNLWGEAIAGLRELIAAGDLVSGEGRLTADDIRRHYINDIAARVRLTDRLRIVVDAGNGTAGVIAPDLFRAWGCDVEELYCEPDSRYPHHQPDPQVAANMADLAAAVVRVGADLGIAFDGDADRMGAVDGAGNVIPADRLLALLARDLLTRRPGAIVVGDVLCSQTLVDEVTRGGGTPILWASGHSLVKEKMRELDAPLGGEMSGHLFMAEDYYGFDDAFVAAGRLLRLITASRMTLAQLDDTLPAYVGTPEYRPHCPDALKVQVIADMRAALEADHTAGGEHAPRAILTVDGVRVQYDTGWGIVRMSNTEPVLSLRFEGKTAADADRIRARFFDLLRAYPAIEVPTM